MYFLFFIFVYKNLKRAQIKGCRYRVNRERKRNFQLISCCFSIFEDFFFFPLTPYNTSSSNLPISSTQLKPPFALTPWSLTGMITQPFKIFQFYLTLKLTWKLPLLVLLLKLNPPSLFPQSMAAAGTFQAIPYVLIICCNSNEFSFRYLCYDVLYDFMLIIIYIYVILSFTDSFNFFLVLRNYEGYVVKRMEGEDAGNFKIAFRTRSCLETMDDGYKWRKYGKKKIKNNPNPRYLIMYKQLPSYSTLRVANLQV